MMTGSVVRETEQGVNRMGSSSTSSTSLSSTSSSSSTSSTGLGLISSLGLGSGLNVTAIINAEVGMVESPIAQLQAQQAKITAQVSELGQLKSLAAAFSDAVNSLALPGGWQAMSASSTSSAVTATVTGAPQVTSFNVQVQQLAQSQETATTAVPAGQALGSSGTLSIQLGRWSSGSGSSSFTAGTAPAVDITLSASDTLSSVASKINAANAGVTATVLTDTTGERLLVQSNATGAAQGFQMETTDSQGQTGSASALSALAFDPQAGSFGMAANAHQSAQDTQATVNNIPVTSSNDTLSGAIAGLSLQVNQVTSTPAHVTVSANTTAAMASVQSFVAAYNALNKQLGTDVQYNSTSNTAGVLEGDSAAENLQNQLRQLMLHSTSASSTFKYLSDVGISVGDGGMLSVNTGKLSTALSQHPDEVRKLFTAGVYSSNTPGASQGLAVQMQHFAQSILSVGTGLFDTKSASFQSRLKQLTKQQSQVTANGNALRAQLQARYSYLDSQLTQTTKMSNYFTQQIGLWNNSSSSSSG